MAVRIAFLNGHFVRDDSALLSPRDAGFQWGATVSERCRTYRRKLFRLPEHLARFRQSCESCRIPQPIPDAELMLFADHLLAENGPVTHPEGELELVLFATPGVDAPNLGMFADPLLLARFQPWYETGVPLVIPPTRQLPAECVPPQAKMRSRMHWWIAEQETKDQDPTASALLLDHYGHVTETAMANFLIVRGRSVISPPRASILHGISLQVVEELCGELGIPFIERALTPAECQSADEAMVASTPFGVLGVSRLNGKPIPWPGTVLGQLREAWSRMVDVDIWQGIAPGH